MYKRLIDMELLFSWAAQQLQKKLGLLETQALHWDMVSGDASFRRYYRAKDINNGHSWIAVYAPPDKEKNHEFVAIAEALLQGGVRAPKVLAVDYQQGFLLQEDFGDQLLLPLLNESTVDDYYSDSINVLLQLQSLPSNKALFSAYDREKLQEELSLFPRWFLTNLLSIQESAEVATLLTHTFDTLLNSALTQPQVLVHRDFHSRNLMVLPNNQIGVIDFQDAVIGPITYDLVSLLRDCYIYWPAEKVQQWIALFHTKAQTNGLLGNVTEEQFTRWFDLMGLQRHLKVLGIFARLALRDGKEAYLGDIPLVMHYVLMVSKGYPELRMFSDWFETQVLPVAKSQSWFKEPRL